MEQIELSTAKKMVDHYQETRKKLIDKTHGVNDTESIWIPLEHFKNFINNLPENATGVRIYLAAYDQHEPHYPNQTTAVIMGTVSDGDDHTDVIASGGALADANRGLEPFNKGKQCPPFC
ncbi:MAG: hypothetical protein AAGC65_18960 [Mucilaginibacter sp.]|uniref:hypothetical protein n=1 Tax=Mucilaginibacter sp. TaxID=1882438 RepID=UPI0031B02156